MRRVIAVVGLLVCVNDVVAAQTVVGRLSRGALPVPPVVSAPTISITTPTSEATAGSAVTPITVGGIASDDVLVSSVTCANNGGMAQAASGTTEWSLSMALSLGANAIICTVTDNGALTGTDTLTVTYSVSDVTPPTTVITSPADLSITGGSSITVSGTAADAVGVDHVEVRVNGGAWSNASNTTTWTKTNVLLNLGANTIEARAYDAAGNVDASPASITVTRVSDAGAPTVVITMNGGSGAGVNYTTATNDMDFTGTCTDDADSVCARCRVFPAEANSLYTSANNYGYAGTNANAVAMSHSGGVWTINNRKPALGTHTYHMRCWDSALNYGEDTIDVTFTRIAVMMTQEAPDAQTGTAYSYDFYADGDTGDFTWDIGSDGVTTFADADCAGLAITDVTVGVFEVGRVSGTPSGSGTCTLTMRAKGATTNASTSINIAIGASALEAANAHFTTVAALDEALPVNGGLSFSFRDATAGSGNALAAYVSDNTFSDGVWTFTTSYAQHNFGLNHHSTQSEDQAKFHFGPNGTWTGYDDGKILVIYDIWWDSSWRVMGCRNGVISQVQGSHWNQKESNLFFGNAALSTGNTNSSIYLETDTEAGGQSGSELCVRSSQHAERMMGNEIASSSMVSQDNPTGVGSWQTCMASSFQQIAEKGIEIYPLTWYRRWYQVELNVPHTEFADHDSCGSDLAAGTYHKVYAWMQSEWDSTPTRRLWAVPSSNALSPNPRDLASELVFEFNTSANPGAIIGNAHLRVRNLLILRNYELPATPESDTTIFKRPVR